MNQPPATPKPRLTRAEKAAREYNEMLRALRTNAGTVTPRR